MNHRPGITVPNKARLRICFNASILFLGLEWADSMDDMDVDSWECAAIESVPPPLSGHEKIWSHQRDIPAQGPLV